MRMFFALILHGAAQLVTVELHGSGSVPYMSEW